MKSTFLKLVVSIRGSKHASYGWSWLVCISRTKPGMPYNQVVYDSSHPTRALARSRAKKLKAILETME